MINVTCEIKEAKKNSTNKIQVTSINDCDKRGFAKYGFVEIKIGKESIIVDGFELQSAIDNCVNNQPKSHRHAYYNPHRIVIDEDEEAEE